MFKQGGANRDYVFPLAFALRQSEGFYYEGFLGTAFIIRENGFVLNANHCVNNIDASKLVGMFIDQENSWCAFKLTVIASILMKMLLYLNLLREHGNLFLF